MSELEIERLREALRVAERVRDDARVQSQRDLDEKRQTQAELIEARDEIERLKAARLLFKARASRFDMSLREATQENAVMRPIVAKAMQWCNRPSLTMGSSVLALDAQFSQELHALVKGAKAALEAAIKAAPSDQGIKQVKHPFGCDCTVCEHFLENEK